MELIRKTIYMNRLKGKTVTQITLDDDRNVPDTKADIEYIIQEQGDVRLDDCRVMGDRAGLRGKLAFHILYQTPVQGAVESLAGDIPFDELVNIDGLEENDHIQVQWDIEDLSADLVNSRKVSVKAVITFTLLIQRIYDEQAAVDASGETSLDCLKKTIEAAQTALQKKDTYRIREEIELPASKPNIREVLWSSLQLRGAETRPMDGGVSLRGELLLFCMYSGEEEHIPVQWLERSVPFSGTVDLPDCTEEMIPAIDVRLQNQELAASPDYDGENRILSLDAVLELDITLYEEEAVEILSDVYAPGKNLEPELEKAYFESLMVKNVSKCRLSDKFTLGGSEKLLQVCHCDGSVKIDQVQVREEGLAVEGAVCVTVLYISADDRRPMQSVKSAVPFQYVVEVKGIAPDCVYRIKPGLEQLAALMLGGDEIEIKAAVTFDVLVLRRVEEQIIRSVAESPLDLDEIERMPGIVGYIVRQGDTLWGIAKKFRTTQESVRQINGLDSSLLKTGQRLLILKEAEEML